MRMHFMVWRYPHQWPMAADFPLHAGFLVLNGYFLGDGMHAQYFYRWQL